MAGRDPREDPRAGDCIHKLGGDYTPVTRYVVKRLGNEVWYRSIIGGDIKHCWLSTWIDFGRGCDIGEGPKDPLPVTTGARKRRPV